MSEWKFFNIDIWWKAVLMLGVLAVVGASLFKIEFLASKHLFGFGLGMIMIGLGFWKAFKTFSQLGFGGILSWKDYKHDIVSVLLIVIGIGLTGLFGFLIIKSLI
ncbi:MAG: hypothetical protein R2764_05085 [Bacteroidales bacterium]